MQTRTNPSRTGCIESSPTMRWSTPRERECSRRWSWPPRTTVSPPPPPRLASSPLRQESPTRLPWPWVLVRSATCMGEPVVRLRSSMPHFLQKARNQGTDRSDVLEALMRETLSRGRRIPGLGHRIHTADPRCDALWSVAEETGVAAECVQASMLASNIFSRVRETTLPMNVDGTIGAIVADMGLPPIVGNPGLRPGPCRRAFRPLLRGGQHLPAHALDQFRRSGVCKGMSVSSYPNRDTFALYTSSSRTTKVASPSATRRSPACMVPRATISRPSLCCTLPSIRSSVLSGQGLR